MTYMVYNTIMSGKYIVLLILSVLAGAGFIACGIYFLSEGFVKKLNEAVAFDETKKKLNKFKAKGSGYMALGIGGLTLVFACFICLMPELVPVLGLVYMIILVLGFVSLTIIFK